MNKEKIKEKSRWGKRTLGFVAGFAPTIAMVAFILGYNPSREQTQNVVNEFAGVRPEKPRLEARVSDEYIQRLKEEAGYVDGIETSVNSVVDVRPKTNSEPGQKVSTNLPNKIAELTLVRDSYGDTSTSGHLYINGKYFCDTLELPDKDNQNNISCIPTGNYGAHARESGNRIDILGIGSRKNIVIHEGNSPKDIEGCILVGSRQGKDFVGNSRETLAKLRQKLREYRNIRLRIQNKPEDYDFSRDDDETLLARMIYGEASGCLDSDGAAVAHTALTRANDEKTWNGTDLRSAILAPKQYSCFNEEIDKDLNKLSNREMTLQAEKIDPQTFYKCRKIARGVLSGQIKNPFPEATHYHDKNIKPKWINNDARMRRLGERKGHVYYRES